MTYTSLEPGKEGGGFKSHVISSKKIGHIHFTFDGDQKEIFSLFTTIQKDLISATSVLTKNMRNRGGGILDVNLIDKTDELIHYYQLEVKFETCDSMGANFINSCLEEMSKYFLESAENQFENSTSKLDIIMSILSNYTPECLVHCEVTCPVSDLIDGPDFSSEEFVSSRFVSSKFLFPQRRKH